ncbi:BofC C-terminal domain-containing protein [Desertibacillus haloalkaliphilus]|uniref:BofC C-terminal domain-containing protein n=1 Tax=Desertibacillus haloalkaliphilus TaxID=1328930 RepID=UPI001C26825B|nr:BofC C-terminal domain-containing protein [Desertibacillus haloalkaliphilus]MBU8905491.1 intercompartmental signaling factor BofC [Desertibacillus haloalkaliphilus]
MKVRPLIVLIKKYPAFIALFFLMSCLIAFSSMEKSVAEKVEDKPPAQQEETYEVMGPKTVEVILEREYLDGEVSEEVVEETIWSMEDFWAFYENWTLVDQAEDKVVFKQQVDDISPLLKINGYFGISEDGTLKLYEGKPTEENVIQSLYQINTKKLKSHQHVNLKEGIPVQSREHYEQVLKTFKKFAIKEM